MTKDSLRTITPYTSNCDRTDELYPLVSFIKFIAGLIKYVYRTIFRAMMLDLICFYRTPRHKTELQYFSRDWNNFTLLCPKQVFNKDIIVLPKELFTSCDSNIYLLNCLKSIFMCLLISLIVSRVHKRVGNLLKPQHLLIENKRKMFLSVLNEDVLLQCLIKII